MYVIQYTTIFCQIIIFFHNKKVINHSVFPDLAIYNADDQIQ